MCKELAFYRKLTLFYLHAWLCFICFLTEAGANYYGNEPNFNMYIFSVIMVVMIDDS